MAKKLNELTERTATDNADLLHINSGGTDYKETKANFLIDLPRRFYPNTSSDLRAQIKAKIDEIGTTVSLYGIIGSYNHQTETGTPINNNFYFEALSSGTTNVKLVITIIGASGRKWESYYSSGAWGEWQEVPWVGSFNKQWSSDTAITTQVDSIGSDVGTYFGYISVGSESVRQTVGLPVATSGLIEARPYNGNYKRIFYYPNGGTRKFVLYKSAGTWQTQWKECAEVGNLDMSFATDTLLTTQAENLPAGVWAGRVSSYGHQQETGVPINSAMHVTIRKYSSQFNEIELRTIGQSDSIYKKAMNNGTWETNWTKAPTRSEQNNSNSWRAVGNVVKSQEGAAVGYGIAIVTREGNFGYIDFEAQFVTAGSNQNIYDVAMTRTGLRAINSSIPSFTPAGAGQLTYYKSDGTIDTSSEGYAGVAYIATAIDSGNGWAMGRVYNKSGSIGAWSDAHYTVGMRVKGRVPIKFI